jgi:hemerythrin superfamily protein
LTRRKLDAAVHFQDFRVWMHAVALHKADHVSQKKGEASVSGPVGCRRGSFSFTKNNMIRSGIVRLGLTVRVRALPSAYRLVATNSAPNSLGDASEARARPREGPSAGLPAPAAASRSDKTGTSASTNIQDMHTQRSGDAGKRSDGPKGQPKSSIDHQHAGADENPVRSGVEGDRTTRSRQGEDQGQASRGIGESGDGRDGKNASKSGADGKEALMSKAVDKKGATSSDHHINAEQNPGLTLDRTRDSPLGSSQGVRAPGAKGGVVGLIKQQHEEIKALMERVTTSRGSERAQAFAQLRTLLLAHEAAEEQVIHPGAADIGAGVDQRVHEEEEVTKMLAKLTAMRPESVEFEQAFVSFRNDVTKHADSEEREELARLSETKGKQELSDMRESVARVEWQHGVDVIKTNTSKARESADNTPAGRGGSRGVSDEFLKNS